VSHSALKTQSVYPTLIQSTTMSTPTRPLAVHSVVPQNALTPTLLIFLPSLCLRKIQENHRADPAEGAYNAPPNLLAGCPLPTNPSDSNTPLTPCSFMVTCTLTKGTTQLQWTCTSCRHYLQEVSSSLLKTFVHCIIVLCNISDCLSYTLLYLY